MVIPGHFVYCKHYRRGLKLASTVFAPRKLGYVASDTQPLGTCYCNPQIDTLTDHSGADEVEFDILILRWPNVSEPSEAGRLPHIICKKLV
jgi:hypothetical protein